MINGLKRVFKGKDALARHISLFSICGIAGLVNGYFMQTDLQSKYICTVFLVLFTLFFTGFETLFMNERELPDIDLRSFKIAFRKIPFAVFVVGIPFLITNLYTKVNIYQLIFTAACALPLSMFQAGFAYKFENSGAGEFFRYFGIKDYIILFLKRILVFAACYAAVIIFICVIFFVLGVVIAIVYKVDLNSIAFILSAHGAAISKLQIYIISVLTMYALSCGTLVWDNELIQTKERKCVEIN